MTMELHKDEKTTYFVGSIKYSSYVQLINSTSKGNCKAVRCRVNNL